MNQRHLALGAIAGRLLPVPVPYHRRHTPSPLARVAAVSLCLLARAFALSSVELAWDSNPETNLAGYKLHYGTTSGQYPQVVDTGLSTSKALSGLADGTTYYFAVSAYNTSGLASSLSAEISYTTPASETTNNAPLANAINVTTAEEASLAVTLSGSDADADSLAFSIVSGPANGILTGTPPNLTYQPKANYHGADQFTFRVNDGTVSSSPATVAITITPVNDAPVASPQSITTAEDTKKNLILAGSDVDGNPLAFSVVTGPAHGTLTGTPPNLSYQPAANYNGSDQFTFRTNDGTANSPSATVQISVTPVNDPPVAIVQTLAATEDTQKSIVLGGSDADGNALGFSIVTAPAHGTLTGTPPNVVYLPAKDYSGSDQFTFRVNDGTVNSATAAVQITIADAPEPNSAPVALSKSLTLVEDTPATFTLQGTDPDGDPLTFIIVGSPAKGTLTGTLPTLTYLPAKNFHGTDQLTFRVNDGKETSALATVVFTVTRTNDRPKADALQATTTKNLPLNLTLPGSDDDGDALKYTILKLPANGVLTGTPPNVIYAPRKKFKGTDQFTYRVNDGIANSKVGIVTITVSALTPALAKTELVPATSLELPELRIKPAKSLAGDGMTISLQGEPGKTYIVECSGNLADWQDLREMVMPASGIADVQVPAAADTSRCYYRLRIP